MTRLLSVIFLCLVVVFPLAGCRKQQNPDGRQDVTGKITLNGKPLKNGTINFSDKSPENAGGAGGLISQGSFTLTGEYGIKPGTYSVKIYAARDYDRATGEVATDQTPMGNLVPIDIIPAEFNKKSQMTFTVEEGKKNVFNLDIVAEEPKVKKGGKVLDL